MPAEPTLRSALGAEPDETVVCGFDFPIGIPRSYAQAVGVTSFVELLPLLGANEWSDFFDVADSPEEISMHRPFYPRTSGRKGEHRREHLTTALGIDTADLLRRCERPQPHRRAACPLFWTLGGNQVGKAALSGWQLLRQQAPDELRIWPFDGNLTELIDGGGTIIVETYPTEFYAHLGLPSVIRKRRPTSRRDCATQLLATADQLKVVLDPVLRAQITSGFGDKPSGEDAFDAVVGLLGMINVISGRRQPGEPRDDPEVVAVEGWILGQDPTVKPHPLLERSRTEPRSPAEVMRAMVAAFDTGVVDDIRDFVDAHYVDHQGLPHLRPIKGPDGFQQVVETARRGYQDLSVEIVDLIEEGDRSAARLVWTGVRPSGESRSRETLEIVRVVNGRAAEHWGGHS